MMRSRFAFFAAALLALSLVLLVTNAAPSTAAAQVDCADASTAIGLEVGTADEFNAAVECINNSPAISPDGFPLSYQIVLLNDIEATTPTSDAVFESFSGGSDVSIAGNGYIMSRAPSAPDTALPLLRFSPMNSVSLVQLGLTLSPVDVSGIDFDGDTLDLLAVGIEATPGSGATGIVATENATSISLGTSSIDGVSIGIVSDSPLVISGSTIRSTGVDVAGPTEEFVFVGNSTLAGPVGVLMTNSMISVNNSTVLGDGGRGGTVDSFIEYYSSIVASCTAPVLIPEDNPEPPGFASVLDFGTNAGGCFDPTHVIDTELTDNGCDLATPFGCPRTVRLSPNSPALGVGECFDVLSDQRGAERTPRFALGCDAGSYEASGCEGSTTTSFTVSSETELNTAIACFNGADAGPGDYQITLAADINSTGMVYPNASFTPIRRFDSSVTLTILGDRFSLTDTGLSTPPAILATDDRNRATVRIENVEFESQRNLPQAILHNSPTPLRIQDSAFTGLAGALPATAIRSMTGSLVVENSTINAATTGIEVRNGNLEVNQATVTALFGVQALQASSFTITNSTFPTGRSIWADTNNGPIQGTIRNSTIGGEGILINGAGSSNIVATSNIFRLPCDGPVVDGGFNVGNCFVDGGPLPELDLGFNDCVVRTANGQCVQVPVIDADSPAVGAGSCTDVETDQRGWPRTPQGPGCDAGSFEAVELDPVDIACEADGSRQFTVGNEGEVNAAIDCFNSGVPGAGSYTITLGNDVFIASAGIGQDAVTSTIDQPSTAFDLTIDGDGHELRATDPLFIGSQFATNQIAIAATNTADVAFSNISVESLNSAIQTVILHGGSGALTAEQSSLGRRSNTNAILASSGPGGVTLRNTIVGTGMGLVIDNGALTVSDSSFLNRGGAPDDLAVVFGGSEQLTVTNSTFDDGSIFLDNGADASIQNSTFTGGGGVRGSLVNTVVTSTLSTECYDGPTDGGNNVGTCLGGTIDVPPSADNGCLEPTPTGCPPTVAISLDSPALGAGLCTAATDQRGEPRTPLGDGCDAGAFELPGFVPAPLGDVDTDGDVDNDDVQALLAYLAGGDTPAGVDVADVNRDGQIRLDDALALSQMVADAG